MKIEWEEIGREVKSWGVEVTIQFTIEGEVVRTSTFLFENLDEVEAELQIRIDNKILHIEIEQSDLNNFTLDEDPMDTLRALIVKIRQTPSLTLSQAVTWHNTSLVESVYNPLVFIDRCQEFLNDELGYTPTWDQFKTYVINNIFEGID